MMGEGLNDNQIFTFIVLLASVLIDNSMGVPTRYDSMDWSILHQVHQILGMEK